MPRGAKRIPGINPARAIVRYSCPTCPHVWDAHNPEGGCDIADCPCTTNLWGAADAA